MRCGSEIHVGKLTFQLKTLVDEETGDEITRRANSVHLTPAEYLRSLVMIHVHGIEHIQMLQAQRLELIARKGPETSGEVRKRTP